MGGYPRFTVYYIKLRQTIENFLNHKMIGGMDDFC